MNFSFAALLNNTGFSNSDVSTSGSGSLTSYGFGVSFDSILSAASYRSDNSGLGIGTSFSDFARANRSENTLPVVTTDPIKDFTRPEVLNTPESISIEIAKEIISEFSSNESTEDNPIHSKTTDIKSDTATCVAAGLDLSGILASMDLPEELNNIASENRDLLIELQLPSEDDMKIVGDSIIIPAKLLANNKAGNTQTVEDTGNFIIDLNELGSILNAELKNNIRVNGQETQNGNSDDPDRLGSVIRTVNGKTKADTEAAASFDNNVKPTVLRSITDRAPASGEEFLAGVLNELMKFYSIDDTAAVPSENDEINEILQLLNKLNNELVIQDELPFNSILDLIGKDAPVDLSFGLTENNDKTENYNLSISFSTDGLKNSFLAYLESLTEVETAVEVQQVSENIQVEGIEKDDDSSQNFRFEVPLTVSAVDNLKAPEITVNLNKENIIIPQQPTIIAPEQNNGTFDSVINDFRNNPLLQAIRDHFIERFDSEAFLKSGKQHETAGIDFEITLSNPVNNTSSSGKNDIIDRLLNALRGIQNGESASQKALTENIIEEIKTDLKDINLTIKAIESSNNRSLSDLQIKSFESSGKNGEYYVPLKNDFNDQKLTTINASQSLGLSYELEAESGYIKDRNTLNFENNSTIENGNGKPTIRTGYQTFSKELDLSENNIKVSGNKLEILPSSSNRAQEISKTNGVSISLDLNEVKMSEVKAGRIEIPVMIKTESGSEKAVLSMSNENFDAFKRSIESETGKPVQFTPEAAGKTNSFFDTQKSENRFNAELKFDIPVQDENNTGTEKILSTVKSIGNEIDIENENTGVQKERSLMLRIPVKQNSSDAGKLPVEEANAVKQNTTQVYKDLQVKGSSRDSFSSIHMTESTKTSALNGPETMTSNTESGSKSENSDISVTTSEASGRYTGENDDKTNMLPGRIEVTLESDKASQQSLKTQGVYVSDTPVKEVKNDKQLSSDSAGFKISEDLNSADRFVSQRAGEETFQNNQQNSFGSFKENERGQREFNNSKNLELQGEKAMSAEKPFEARLSEAEKPKADHIVKVWDIEKLADKITKMAKFTVNKEQSEMKIQLEPKHLGRMSMKLSVEDHQLNGTVRVETHEAKALIQDNLPQLRESIADKGVDIQKLDVFVQSDQQHQLDQSPWTQSERFGTQKTGENTNSIGREGDIPADETVETEKMREFGYNTIELVA